MATTKIITIHRHNLPYAKAWKLARAFVTVAGESEVEVMLRGPWMMRQSCVPLLTPCTAQIGLDDFEVRDLAICTIGSGATVDLKVTMPLTYAYGEKP